MWRMNAGVFGVFGAEDRDPRRLRQGGDRLEPDVFTRVIPVRDDGADLLPAIE